MIGKVVLPNKQEIVLTDNGNIQCDHQGLLLYSKVLLTRHRMRYSPAKGAFGVKFLSDLATSLKGRVFIEKKQGAPPGTVY